MHEWRAPAAGALVAALRADCEGTSLNGVNEHALLELVEAHRIAGLLHDHLNQCAHELTPATAARVRELRQLAWVSNVKATRLARTLRAVLDEAIGPKWLIVKGPALASWYGAPNHRSYADLDLLVSRRAFGDAMAALEAAGFPPLTANWEGFLTHGVGEVPMGSYDLSIDLHWHVLGVARIRRHFDFDIDQMIERQSTYGEGNDRFPTLDPEDTLLHLCVHGGISGARRLVWLLDLDAVVRSDRIDWQVFVERALAARAAMMSVTMLEKAMRKFDTPVPKPVLQQLNVVPVLRRLSRIAASMPRSDAKRCASWSPGLIQSITRDSLGATLAAGWQATKIEMGVLRGKPRIGDPGGDIDWHGPDAGPAGKRRWLDYVASDAA